MITLIDGSVCIRVSYSRKFLVLCPEHKGQSDLSCSPKTKSQSNLIPSTFAWSRNMTERLLHLCAHLSTHTHTHTHTHKNSAVSFLFLLCLSFTSLFLSFSPWLLGSLARIFWPLKLSPAVSLEPAVGRHHDSALLVAHKCSQRVSFLLCTDSCSRGPPPSELWTVI